MSRVVFRADASAAIGAGHAMRCSALSRAFSAGGWSVGFACTGETFEIVHAFRALSVDRLVIERGADEAAAIAARWPAIDVLVVDHYGRDNAFEKACRQFCKRVVVIDDLANRAHDCDVLVDSSAPSADPYRGLVPPGCRVLTGPAYAPLAPEFRAARPHALARRDGRPVERVLVSFGQADAGNATELALRALASAGFSGTVDVAIGSAAPCLASLRRYSGNHANVRLHVDATNMPELMTAADFAIGAGGTTSWERCCLGLPSAMIEIAENQRGVITYLEKHDAGVSLGLIQQFDADGAVNALCSLLGDPEKRKTIAINSASLVDGVGGIRILLATVGQHADVARYLTLRLADEGDEGWLLSLQRNPVTRQYSRNPEPPTLEEHQKWMQATLLDPAKTLLIAVSGDARVGMARLDQLANQDGLPHFEVSIAVSPTWHGQGVGSAILSLLRRLVPGALLDAVVFPGNEGSVRLFRSNGYDQLNNSFYRSRPR